MNIAIVLIFIPQDAEVCLSPYWIRHHPDSALFWNFQSPLTLDDIINCLSIPCYGSNLHSKCIKNYSLGYTLKNATAYYLILWFSWNYWKTKNGKTCEIPWRQRKRFSSLIAFSFCQGYLLIRIYFKILHGWEIRYRLFHHHYCRKDMGLRTLLVLLRKIFLLNSKNISLTTLSREESLYVKLLKIFTQLWNRVHCSYIQYPLATFLKGNNWIKNIPWIFQYAGREWVVKKNISWNHSWENFRWKQENDWINSAIVLLLNRTGRKNSVILMNPLLITVETEGNESKHHPLGYQQKVLESWNRKFVSLK